MTKKGRSRQASTISEYQDFEVNPVLLTPFRSFVKPVPLKTLNAIVAQLRN